MILSSLGNVFSKKAGKTLAKEMISGYIGVAIVFAGCCWYFLEPVVVINNDHGYDPIEKLFPSDPWLWVQIVCVSLMGSMQQYFNICE